MNRESLERFPALAAAIALHVGVIVAILLLGNVLDKPVYGPNVVSVTLVNTQANPSPSVVTETPSVTPAPPTPDETPTPTPVPPAPIPKPVQASPKPTPNPSPKPTPVAPTKTTKPTTKPVTDDNGFFGQITGDLGGSTAKSHPRPPSNTASGTGARPSAASMTDLAKALGQLWIPNCNTYGGADINITITVNIQPGDRLSGVPTSSAATASDPLVRVASDRAIRAVLRYFSDPDRPRVNRPPGIYPLLFDSKQACANR